MNKTFPAIILVLVIILLIVFGVYTTQNDETPVNLPSPTPTVEETMSVPSEFISGNSRFSQGSCTTDEDCVISGCSAEVCGNEDAITTCEYSHTFPNDEKYDCGCVNNVCGWSN